MANIIDVSKKKQEKKNLNTRALQHTNYKITIKIPFVFII